MTSKTQLMQQYSNLRENKPICYLVQQEFSVVNHKCQNCLLYDKCLENIKKENGIK